MGAIAALDQVRDSALFDGVGVVTHLLLLVTTIMDIHEIGVVWVVYRGARTTLQITVPAV